MAALAAAVLAAACDGTGSADGARGPCAAGGQILGECGEVETIEDACWKLVECGVMPVEHQDPNARDWQRCVDELSFLEAHRAEAVVACVDASSCDALLVNDSPNNPFEWPDCFEGYLP
jgi:hypothetical protein